MSEEEFISFLQNQIIQLERIDRFFFSYYPKRRLEHKLLEAEKSNKYPYYKLYCKFSDFKKSVRMEQNKFYSQCKDVFDFANNSCFDQTMIDYGAILVGSISILEQETDSLLDYSAETTEFDIEYFREMYECDTHPSGFNSIDEMSDLNHKTFYKLQLFCDIFAGKAGSWYQSSRDDTDNPISLKKFLIKHCGLVKPERLRDIAQSINKANLRGQIVLPKQVETKVRGSAKTFYYSANELLKAWPEFMEKISFLPGLK